MARAAGLALDSTEYHRGMDNVVLTDRIERLAKLGNMLEGLKFTSEVTLTSAYYVADEWIRRQIRETAAEIDRLVAEDQP